MSWEDFLKIDIDYFVTQRHDDFDPNKYINSKDEDKEFDTILERRAKNTHIQLNSNNKSILSNRESVSDNKNPLLLSSSNRNEMMSMSNKSLSNVKINKYETTEDRAKDFEKKEGSKKEKVRFTKGRL